MRLSAQPDALWSVGALTLTSPARGGLPWALGVRARERRFRLPNAALIPSPAMPNLPRICTGPFAREVG